ncbi:MAG: hypothetical protein LGB70_08735 [Sulfurovum sp.]|nr:hypothetical protein [Sulfurovum sp.]MCB4751324.1 hypothetical protein [Sulfurovum sp.]MCB4752754.1 hypothetical protein [Sulfurovum sp.]MCB4754132.1 hypothetical protein [Sulfurovum sp.]MCB4758918.1 hypothetical protein [Sulfurovum sp.]
MNKKNLQSKEELLEEIDKLIAYGKEEPTISPNLLSYLSMKDLENIKSKLLERVNMLSDEDKVWLEQFKKYE